MKKHRASPAPPGVDDRINCLFENGLNEALRVAKSPPVDERVLEAASLYQLKNGEFVSGTYVIKDNQITLVVGDINDSQFQLLSIIDGAILIDEDKVRMKIVAVLTDPKVVDRIMRHLDKNAVTPRASPTISTQIDLTLPYHDGL